MNKIIEQRNYSSWPQLINDLKSFERDGRIFRGQSNEYRLTNTKALMRKVSPKLLTNEDIDFKSWPLISSFDRYYSSGFYEFRTYLSQQFEDGNFKARFGKHNFLEIFYLKDCCLLERLYYLQHYGIPTCFLDFSHDPLTALFFAISGVRASSLYDVYAEQPMIHPEGVTISLFELNYKAISQLLNIKNVKKDLSFMKYSEYKVNYVHFAFDITPIDNCQLNTLNDNMKRQKGCFVLFDNNGSQFTLIEFLNKELREKELFDPLIVEYKLEYNEIFKRYDFEGLSNITLYNYLDLNNISGRTLFNDIQGLKYDLNFFHH